METQWSSTSYDRQTTSTELPTTSTGMFIVTYRQLFVNTCCDTVTSRLSIVTISSINVFVPQTFNPLPSTLYVIGCIGKTTSIRSTIPRIAAATHGFVASEHVASPCTRTWIRGIQYFIFIIILPIVFRMSTIEEDHQLYATLTSIFVLKLHLLLEDLQLMKVGGNPKIMVFLYLPFLLNQ